MAESYQIDAERGTSADNRRADNELTPADGAPTATYPFLLDEAHAIMLLANVPPPLFRVDKAGVR
jgi:hypothetical protein